VTSANQSHHNYSTKGWPEQFQRPGHQVAELPRFVADKQNTVLGLAALVACCVWGHVAAR